MGNTKYFDAARIIARWHHENWDGTGYPDGLKGEEIPIAVRIVRLVDTYDALVTKRHYKDAWPHEKAFDEVVKWSGSYFDPEVVEAFKRLHKKMVCLIPCG